MNYFDRKIKHRNVYILDEREKMKGICEEQLWQNIFTGNFCTKIFKDLKRRFVLWVWVDALREHLARDGHRAVVESERGLVC